MHPSNDRKENLVEPPGTAPGSEPLIARAFIAIVHKGPFSYSKPGRLFEGAGQSGGRAAFAADQDESREALFAEFSGLETSLRSEIEAAMAV